MSFRSIVADIRDGFGSKSRRRSEIRQPLLHKARFRGEVHEFDDLPPIMQNSCWATLPPEFLHDVLARLEKTEIPTCKHIVACASVCMHWREMIREIVQRPEFTGKITFPVSLKQPGPRQGMVRCYIKRDKSKMTYHLFLSLSPALFEENGKFLLFAKRNRRTTCTEYVISMDANNISKSSSTYIGKLRSNFLGSKFVICDTQPSYNGADTQLSYNSAHLSLLDCTSCRFLSKKVSPKVPAGTYRIAQIAYEPYGLNKRGPRHMHCIMHSIPASSLESNGTVPGQAALFPRCLEDSSSKLIDSSSEFGSSRFSDIFGGPSELEGKDAPVVLKNKAPRWHEQRRFWCLNFGGRVTMKSVKNFQLIADTKAATSGEIVPPQQSGTSDANMIILQFGKVRKDMFSMDFKYPLSAFQAFAICLSSFDTKIGL